MTDNIFPPSPSLSKSDRERILDQRALVIWLTGLSGSGKTTLGKLVEERLLRNGRTVFLLDGDSLREGLNRDLDFTVEARNENIRRAGEICKLLSDSGMIVIATFISPLKSQRDAVKKRFGENEFMEVFIDTPLEECEKRDVKGLYKKARAGEIRQFTGIDSPYEIPPHADLVINTSENTIQQSADQLYNAILKRIELN